MNAPHALLVALGAMVGAPLRYHIDRFVQARHDSLLPWGTVVVNVAGSLILGALASSVAPEPLRAAAGVGFCGALTTYSTFGYETVRLIEDGSALYAAASVAANLVAGLGAAFLGGVLVDAS